MLSNFPFTVIKNYYNHYNLNNYTNIIVAQDSALNFGNYYKAQGVPYFAFYNKKKNLKQVLIGKINISLIKDIALE